MGRDPAILGLAMPDARADHIRQVLVQRSAARHIDRLGAATDAQDRQINPQGLMDNRVLERVEIRLEWHPALRVAGRRTPRVRDPDRR